MNISAWTIYWFIKLDAIRNIFAGFLPLSVIIVFLLLAGAGAFWLFSQEAYGESEENLKKNGLLCFKYFKRLLIIPIFCIIMKEMLPTTKEMAAIYVIPKIANSSFVNETLPAEMKDIYSMAKEWMKETLAVQKIALIEPVKHSCSNCEQKK